MTRKASSNKKKNILIATFGITPDIIKESLGVFCYSDTHDLYAENSIALADVRAKSAAALGGENSVDELWLISTEQKNSDSRDGVEDVRKWMENYVPCQGVAVKSWILKGVEDIENDCDVRKFHDLVLRVLCYARNYNNGNVNLLVSLAGGRKTMSADLQDAVYCFGCEVFLHVLSLSKVGNPKVDNDGLAMPAKYAQMVLPLLLDASRPNPLFGALRSDLGSLPQDENGKILVSISETEFLKQVQELRDRAKYFYTSFAQKQEYVYDNFPILYTLSQETQDVLKNFKVGSSLENKAVDFGLLKTLPKSDLHCHLGGCLTVEEMVAVAATVRGKIDAEKSRNSNFRDWVPKGPKTGESWKDWRHRVASELQMDWRLVAPAYLLSFKDNPQELEKVIYGDYVRDGENDDLKFVGVAIEKVKTVGKGEQRSLDLTPYEILGDLQGTSLLCHKETIGKTVEILLNKCYEDGVRCLEIRCSPLNYVNESESLTSEVVVETILNTIESFCRRVNDSPIDRMRVSILFIASRHSDRKKIEKGIELYQTLSSENSKSSALFKRYFRGFDLAGNESAAEPKDMRDLFENVMQDCLNITIHAGETMPVDRIWQAVYCLNAERIGHGLTLKNNTDLEKKFRERRIGIEMCPSSNYQVIGFRDNYMDGAEARRVKGKFLQEYPLKNYLDKNLRVSINTDDPGISRTCMTNELLKAGRLTHDGLSLWNVFSLLYNGFDTAFLPFEQKNELLADMNESIRLWIENNIGNVETELKKRG